MDIVQSPLGFMEDIRQRPMHRGAARRWGRVDVLIRPWAFLLVRRGMGVGVLCVRWDGAMCD
jgi:hypothetical protein